MVSVLTLQYFIQMMRENMIAKTTELNFIWHKHYESSLRTRLTFGA